MLRVETRKTRFPKGGIMKTTHAIAWLAVLAAAAPLASAADKFDIGKFEFERSCATCHGTDGKGKGSFAQALQLSVPDITTMEKRNGGVFPFLRTYEVIDGRQQVKAHGTREMPIWGKHYAYRGTPAYDDFSYDPEATARARILGLIDYLHRLQGK